MPTETKSKRAAPKRGASAENATLTIRIPRDVLNAVHQSAQHETRSVNGQIVQLVKEALATRAMATAV